MSIGRDTRPLTARSVIASNLLGVDPPRLPVAALVAAGELFGLTSGATRTALSRMVRAGEVSVDDGWYTLQGALADRARRQADARIGATRPWDGTWLVAIVTADRRPASARAALRTAMRRLKLVEIREGVWARPDNLDPDRNPTERDVVAAACDWLRGAVPDDVDTLVAPFELPAWADGARTFVRRLDEHRPALEAGSTDALGDRFVLAADALRHLVDDPSLPAALLPDDWPGDLLRSTYASYDRAFKTVMARWTRTR